MRSNKEIKKLAKVLYLFSKEDGSITLNRVKDIINLIKNPIFKNEFKIEGYQINSLLKEYNKYIKNALIEDSITITSPVEFSGEEIRKNEIHLKEKYKKNFISFIKDPDVIAGIKIQTGWDITDLTVQNKFNTLNK